MTSYSLFIASGSNKVHSRTPKHPEAVCTDDIYSLTMPASYLNVIYEAVYIVIPNVCFKILWRRRLFEDMSQTQILIYASKHTARHGMALVAVTLDV